ncbi:MAG: 2-C-methyl-D-erythritol 2,4-cyclodiphosphate synthase [bacterium]|nr:2-C-methyl-D-erythritol 2,4-cyclodiphosphate synthase [bacterium]
MRVGWGFDAHRIGGDGPMHICGVIVENSRGLIGTSDGDVGLHAVADALLGAAALGDLGQHFPSSDPQWIDADSSDLLAHLVRLLEERGAAATNVDVTIIAEKVRISSHRSAMQQRLAELLHLPLSHVSVKATTTDGMGYLGRDEGVAATAVVTLDG